MSTRNRRETRLGHEAELDHPGGPGAPGCRSTRSTAPARVAAADTTDEPAERSDDFALAAAWDRVVGEVEQARSRTWATVLIDTRFVPILRDHFGIHCHPDENLADGRSRVRIAAPTPVDIARTLAGWGSESRSWTPSQCRRS